MSTTTLIIPDMYGSLFILGLIYVGYESYKAYLARKRTQEWYSFFRGMALYSAYLYIYNYPEPLWKEWWYRIHQSRSRSRNYRDSSTARESSTPSMSTPGVRGSYSEGVEPHGENSNGTTTGYTNPGVYT